MAEPVKLCTRCGRPGQFWKASRERDGLQDWCKDCINRQRRIRHLQDALPILSARYAAMQIELDSLLAGGPLLPKRRGQVKGLALVRDVRDRRIDPRVVSDWKDREDARKQPR